jgi:Tfp pilus assembly protein PilF
MQRWIRCLTAIFAPLLLSACASMAPSALLPVAELFDDAAFKPPSAPVSTAGLFALSEPMQAYLRSAEFAAQVRRHGPERGLIEALHRKGQLKLDYDSTRTRTAAETFDEKAGNCMSLVVMTAAFARAMKLEVEFQDVLTEENWRRAGNMYIASTHVNLRIALRPQLNQGAIFTTRTMLTVDFMPPSEAELLSARPIGENELVAMYQNNRAAEALTLAKLDDAYWWARAAMSEHPNYINAYNTLAVVYQQRGMLGQAERVHRVALQREPENTIMMRNLAGVLAQQGKLEESRALLAQLKTLDPQPPYHYFNKGLTAMQNGDYPLARSHFAREVKRAPYNDEFHFWLALAHVALGNSSAAIDQLSQAVEHSTRQEERRVYSSKLAQLRAATRAAAHGFRPQDSSPHAGEPAF